ncbi:MAG: hypothetical protein AB1796_01535 [Bacillota bacterium]
MSSPISLVILRTRSVPVPVITCSRYYQVPSVLAPCLAKVL